MDVDEDRKADIVNRGEYIDVRSAAFPWLNAVRTWVRIPSKGDAFEEAGVRDLVERSRLGPDLGLVQLGQAGMIPRVQSFIDSGERSPQEFVGGLAAPDAEPNTEVGWTLADGSLRSISVSYRDQAASLGVESESYQLEDAPLETPPVPDADDVMDAGDLSAAGLLETTAEWSGTCRGDAHFLPTETIACYRRSVADSTASEWMDARRGQLWTHPDECD